MSNPLPSDALRLPFDQVMASDRTRRQYYALAQVAANESDTLRAAALVAEESGVPFTDTSRAALLWVLSQHKSEDSPTGQAVRFALGLDASHTMTDAQLVEARRWEVLHGAGVR